MDGGGGLAARDGAGAGELDRGTDRGGIGIGEGVEAHLMHLPLSV